MPIVGVSYVGPTDAGPWSGRPCIGCSLAVDAVGKKLFQAPYGVDADGVFVIDVPLRSRPARGTNWPAHWAHQSGAD
jgi:hypothetical protein